ncbi:hypothetical protein EA462_13940 [Natrarchaeobius halalkaliphilus]|uniref:Phenylacetic acid degradation PaaB family protein n=1 Tax=Natrarchaeobius halalkaliphilus TaxID=1679091 RepID=A0A3N6M5F6_9EURY|nr:hypothetical protein [Natrarchaeobius halalkaliphilus]RQG87959.1 hypothetical protein EA462_13940 [Natrarchaeobius halalkaliphilus]
MKGKRTYEVLARINAGEPLQSIGSVDASSDEFAKQYAEMFYDEEDWEVLFVVDRKDILKVSGDPGHEYKDVGGEIDDGAVGFVKRAGGTQ